MDSTLSKLKMQEKEQINKFGNITYLNWRLFYLSFFTFNSQAYLKKGVVPFKQQVNAPYNDAGFTLYLTFSPNLRVSNMQENIFHVTDEIEKPMNTFAYSEQGSMEITYAPPVILTSVYLRRHSNESSYTLAGTSLQIVCQHLGKVVFAPSWRVFDNWGEYTFPSDIYVDKIIIPYGVDVDNLFAKVSLFSILLME